MLNCLNFLKRKTAAPLEQFQRLLGHMASAAAVTPLGLLHMRPLQHWLHGRVPRWAWQRPSRVLIGMHRHRADQSARNTEAPWERSKSIKSRLPSSHSCGAQVTRADASRTSLNTISNGGRCVAIDVHSFKNLHRHPNTVNPTCSCLAVISNTAVNSILLVTVTPPPAPDTSVSYF